MLTTQRARLFDLLKKNAPILFIAHETGLSPSQIVQLSNQPQNATQKTNRRALKNQNRANQVESGVCQVSPHPAINRKKKGRASPMQQRP